MLSRSDKKRQLSAVNDARTILATIIHGSMQFQDFPGSKAESVQKCHFCPPFSPVRSKKCLFANKGCPEAVNLHMQLISDDKYYDNVHFRYTLIFDYFGAPLGVKRGSKRFKTCLFATKWYSEAVNLHMQHIAVENYYDNVHCLCKQFMNHWPRIIFIWHYSTYYCWNISRI